jgi:hypothetical protein
METGISLSCFGDDGDGVTLWMASPEVELSLPLDHAAALKAAASILLCAGVTDAVFRDGTLYEPGGR